MQKLYELFIYKYLNVHLFLLYMPCLVNKCQSVCTQVKLGHHDRNCTKMQMYFCHNIKEPNFLKRNWLPILKRYLFPILSIQYHKT